MPSPTTDVLISARGITTNNPEIFAVWSRAREAWPLLGAHREAFVRRVELIVASGEVTLVELRAADLYLAVACVLGDPNALTAFEEMLAPVRATLLRIHRDASLVDDGLQTVRYRLLIATPEREAKLGTYRGRGSLAGWLRVVAMRQVRELAGIASERDDATLLADAIADKDPVLDVLVRTHGSSVRRMFRDALAALDPRQRSLLRLEILDGVHCQRIAEIHGVHRTTALRWLDDVRATLAHEVRRQLKQELGLGNDSAESLLRALFGQVELSLASGLLPAA